MQKIRHILIGLALVVSSFVNVAIGIATPVSALDCAGADKDTAACKVQAGVNSAGGTNNNKTDLTTFITNIINVLLFVIGAVAVIMIIIGGIRYVTSNGDQTQVKGAKDTIMYSVIGLVVAILAYAIVQFVVTNIK